MEQNKVADVPQMEVEVPLTNQSNELNHRNLSSQIHQKMSHAKECRRKLIPKMKIFWALLGFVVSVADVTVIIYLSYLHFSHSSDIVAWLMLLPILLNFVGMYTFLSNKSERREMEALGCRSTKNLMFFPVIGPSVGALRLFVYAFQEKNAEKFERLESLLIRLKEYESFFRAAPEAFVQITFRIISWSPDGEFRAEDRWTTACIMLCIYALAESHMYGVNIKYYRMFTYDPSPDAWRTDHIQFKWKALLFFFTYFSINSRIMADGIQKATACFFFSNTAFAEVIIINFLTQFVIRAAIYSAYNSWLGSLKRQEKIQDEGVYGAFTYSWRCLFLSLDFQSYSKWIFIWFYLENFLMLLTPYVWIYGTPWFGYTSGNNPLEGKTIFHVYVGYGLLQSLLAIIIKIGVRIHFKRRNSLKISNSA